MNLLNTAALAGDPKTQNSNGEALKSRVIELSKLSTIPAVLKLLLDAVEDETTSSADIEHIIAKDQAISSRIISLANSPYYGIPRRVSNLTQAIVILGLSTIKSIAITTSVFSGLDSRHGMDVRELWVHSFKTATAASLIAASTGLVNRESAFLAGLLHDIGRAVLLQIYGAQYVAAVSGKGDIVTLEERAFGATHPLVGAWFTEKCRLPEECTRAIRTHHDPVLARPNDTILGHLSPVVYMADQIASGTEGLGADPVGSPNEEILRLLSIDEGKFAEIREAAAGVEEAAKRIFYAD